MGLQGNLSGNSSNSWPKNLLEVREKTLPLINQELDRFFDEMRDRGFHWNSEMSRYHFATGGKRLRALIPAWVYAAYGADPTAAVKLGCAIELIHNATLVHDDLQDRDTIRRGLPTVWSRFGEAQAINCGDALFQFAFTMCLGMKLPAERFGRICQRLVRGTLEVIEGQAQEFLMKEESSPGLDRYLGVVRGKTAALIATAVVCAMEALGCDPQSCDQAEAVALRAGILFQIQDDLLDIYGDKQREKPASDIAEGKISALIACLNEKTSRDEQQRVAEILRTPRETTAPQQIQEILALFEKYQISQVLLERVQGLQEEIGSPQSLRNAPPVHQLLGDITTLFLRPIQHLMVVSP